MRYREFSKSFYGGQSHYPKAKAIDLSFLDNWYPPEPTHLLKAESSTPFPWEGTSSSSIPGQFVQRPQEQQKENVQPEEKTASVPPQGTTDLSTGSQTPEAVASPPPRPASAEGPYQVEEWRRGQKAILDPEGMKHHPGGHYGIEAETPEGEMFGTHIEPGSYSGRHEDMPFSGPLHDALSERDEFYNEGIPSLPEEDLSAAEYKKWAEGPQKEAKAHHKAVDSGYKKAKTGVNEYRSYLDKQIGDLRGQMKEYKANGEEIPQELIDKHDQLSDISKQHKAYYFALRNEHTAHSDKAKDPMPSYAEYRESRAEDAPRARDVRGSDVPEEYSAQEFGQTATSTHPELEKVHNAEQAYHANRPKAHVVKNVFGKAVEIPFNKLDDETWGKYAKNDFGARTALHEQKMDATKKAAFQKKKDIQYLKDRGEDTSAHEAHLDMLNSYHDELKGNSPAQPYKEQMGVQNPEGSVGIGGDPLPQKSDDQLIQEQRTMKLQQAGTKLAQGAGKLGSTALRAIPGVIAGTAMMGMPGPDQRLKRYKG